MNPLDLTTHDRPAGEVEKLIREFAGPENKELRQKLREKVRLGSGAVRSLTQTIAFTVHGRAKLEAIAVALEKEMQAVSGGK